MESADSTLIKTFSKTQFESKERLALKFINRIYDYAIDNPLSQLSDILKEEVFTGLLYEIEPDFDKLGSPIDIDTENSSEFNVHYTNFNTIVSAIDSYFIKHSKCGELMIKKTYSFKNKINVNLLLQNDKEQLIAFVDGIFLLSLASSLNEFFMPKIEEVEDELSTFFIEVLDYYLTEEEEGQEEEQDDEQKSEMSQLVNDEEVDLEEEKDEMVDNVPVMKKSSSKNSINQLQKGRQKPKYVKKFTTKTSILYGNFDKTKLFCEIDKLRARNEELEAFKNTLIQSVTSLEEQKKTFDDKLSIMEMEKEEWVDKYNDILNELNNHNRQSETLITETNKELNKVTDLEHQINQKNQEIRNIEEQFEAERKQYQLKIKDLQRDVELLLKAKGENDSLKATIDQLKADHKIEHKEVKEKIADYEKDMAISAEKIKLYLAELDRFKKSDHMQKELIKEQEMQLEEFNQNINMSEKDNKKSFALSFGDDDDDKLELMKEKDVEIFRTREKNKTLSIKLNQKEGHLLQLQQENKMLIKRQSVTYSDMDSKRNAEIDQYKNMLTNSQEEIMHLNLLVEEINGKYDNALEEIEKHIQQKDVFKRVITEKQIQIDDLQIETNQKDTLLKEKEVILTDRQNMINDMQKNFKMTANQSGTLESLLKEKEEIIQETQSELKDKNALILDIKTQLQSKEEALITTQTQLNEKNTLIVDYKAQIKGKDETIMTTQTQLNEKTQYILESQLQRKENETIINDIKTKNDTLQQENKHLSETITKIKEEHSDVLKSNETNKGWLNDIKIEKDRLRVESEGVQSELRKAINVLSKEKNELLMIKENLEKKSNSNNKQKLLLDEKDLLIKKLQNNKRQYQQEINNLQKANELYCKESNEKENEIKYYKQLVDQIKAQQKNEYDTLTGALYELALQFKIVRNDIAKKNVIV